MITPAVTVVARKATLSEITQNPSLIQNLPDSSRYEFVVVDVFSHKLHRCLCSGSFVLLHPVSSRSSC